MNILTIYNIQNKIKMSHDISNNGYLNNLNKTGRIRLCNMYDKVILVVTNYKVVVFLSVYTMISLSICLLIMALSPVTVCNCTDSPGIGYTNIKYNSEDKYNEYFIEEKCGSLTNSTNNYTIYNVNKSPDFYCYKVDTDKTCINKECYYHYSSDISTNRNYQLHKNLVNYGIPISVLPVCIYILILITTKTTKNWCP